MCHRALFEREVVLCLVLGIACAVQENTTEPPAGQSSVSGSGDASGSSGSSSGAGATSAGNSGGGAGGSSGGAREEGGAGGSPAGGEGGKNDEAGAGGADVCVTSDVVLAPVADADIRADSATANTGATGDFQVRRFGANSSWRGVVTFDLTVIPFDANVVAATLVLTMVGASGVATNVAVYRVEPGAQPWDEMQVTWQAAALDSAWATPGGDFATTSTAVAAIAASAQTAAQVTWDVTADAASFVATPLENRGWIVKDEAEPAGGAGELVAFAARNHAEAS
jgi:hypothetical protein